MTNDQFFISTYRDKDLKQSVVHCLHVTFSTVFHSFVNTDTRSKTF